MTNGREDMETELRAELILVLSEKRAAFCGLSTLNPLALPFDIPLCIAPRGSCLDRCLLQAAEHQPPRERKWQI